MRQVGMAIASHAESRKYFPGWRNAVATYSTLRSSTTVTEACVSWTIPILPHLEEDPIYQWYTSYTPTTAANPPETKIRTYVCPSQGDVENSTPLSYAVNGGTGGEVLNMAVTPAAQFVGDGVFIDAVGNLPNSPIFDATRPTYSSARTGSKTGTVDGRASTILLSERAGPHVPEDITWSANPRAVRPNAGALAANHTILHPIAIGNGSRADVQVINPNEATRPLPDPAPANANLDDWMLRYPSSRHPNGVNIVFCDSHMKFVRDNIDPWVYCQLLSSDSGCVSSVVADWQQRVDDSGYLTPYTFNSADLVK
jgi:prepilin-type processing-associated H-X9-DG protein